MIVEEYKSDSTIIRIDDRDIESEEKSIELLNILMEIIIKNVSKESPN